MHIYIYNTSGYTVYPHIIILRVVHPPPIPIIFVMEKNYMTPPMVKTIGPPGLSHRNQSEIPLMNEPQVIYHEISIVDHYNIY